MHIACIVPSCREAQVSAFVRAWLPELVDHDVHLYVVEDGPTRSFQIDAGLVSSTHLCWADAPESLLECISIRSPGCRQIGFWRAYHDGADIFVTLDDDVRPCPDEQALATFAEILTSGVPRWIDPLLNYRSRGYPTANVGRLAVAFHVGAFFGIPDVDGETQIAREHEFAERPPRYHERPLIVPAGQFVPVNGGICGWQRALTPYVHYTLWDPALDYRRFDDIWMGVIVKHVLDLAGQRMSIGPPGVIHARASDPRQNAQRERAGKAWNERFWEALAEAVDRRSTRAALSLAEAWTVVADALNDLDNPWATREAAAMRRWSAFYCAD